MLQFCSRPLTAAGNGEAYWGPYAAAYGGLEILARTWSDEAEQNTTLRFNTIDPGPMRNRDASEDVSR